MQKKMAGPFSPHNNFERLLLEHILSHSDAKKRKKWAQAEICRPQLISILCITSLSSFLPFSQSPSFYLSLFLLSLSLSLSYSLFRFLFLSLSLQVQVRFFHQRFKFTKIVDGKRMAELNGQLLSS